MKMAKIAISLGWVLACGLGLQACGSNAPARTENSPIAQIDDSALIELQPDSLADKGCPRNCSKACCRYGVCEPTCKTTCEVYNLTCTPLNECSLIRVGDPNYDSLRQIWQTGYDRGVFHDESECKNVAGLGARAVGYICDALAVTVVGGLICSACNYVGERENRCFCAELNYHRGADTVQGWVVKAYRECLGRDPESQGAIDGWAAHAASVGYDAMKRGICFSPEGRNHNVTLAYRQCLGRDPESQGAIDTWSNHAASVGYPQMTQDICNSPEGQAHRGH